MRLPLRWIRRPRLTILQWIVSVAVASPPLAMIRVFLPRFDPSFADFLGLMLAAFCFSSVFLLLFWGVIVLWIDPTERLLGRPRWSHAEVIYDPEGITWEDEVRSEPIRSEEEIRWIESTHT